jgi:hypothetical protein
MKIYRTIIVLKIISLSLIIILFISCRGKSVKSGMLVATVAPGNIQHHDYVSDESWRYIPGTRIIAFNPDKPASVKVLTEDFYSACYPDISYDGKHMLFAARQKTGDLWQIWEMDLDNLKSRRITSFIENCTDPAYLPGGRLVFGKRTVNDTVNTAHCLYTCNPDGSDTRQITFSPQASFATTVLKDGRLLAICRQLMPDRGCHMLTVMRPDGTKADMFYKAAGSSTLISSPKETEDGRIVFIESAQEDLSSGDMISISYNRPLHTRINLTSEIRFDINFVLPLNPDKYLVSCRYSDSDNFALYEFDPDKKLIGSAIFSDPGYTVLDVAVVEKNKRPKKLPSEVDMEVRTGLLLCQDINFLEVQAQENYSDVQKARMIEVLGVDTTYGVVGVEDDGSFYLKVMADTPFRIRTLDEKGNVVNGPCSWLWLRPNERRGCVGCHEDPELVPDNRVSLALKKSPVIIPVHIKEVKEKFVELE